MFPLSASPPEILFSCQNSHCSFVLLTRSIPFYFISLEVSRPISPHVCVPQQINLPVPPPLVLAVLVDNQTVKNSLLDFLRKEVIQPHLPIRLPCYDFTPVIEPAFGSSLLTVRSLTSGIPNSHGVTGGVYKTRERIHRDILIRDY